jgi:uncharacterized protein (DUF849 family)
MDKVIIAAAVTGSCLTREMNPAVPRSLKEFAGEPQSIAAPPATLIESAVR